MDFGDKSVLPYFCDFVKQPIRHVSACMSDIQAEKPPVIDENEIQQRWPWGSWYLSDRIDRALLLSLCFVR